MSFITTRRSLPRLAALVVLSLSTLCASAPVHAAGRPGTPSIPLRDALVQVHNGAFTLAGRPLPYLHGINYEGSPDRPWQMWQDGKFDPDMIARDFDSIAAAGYNPVRIFIQHPLPDEILDGDFSRLDTVVGLAAARGLRLLITFNDDGDPDLRRVTRVESLVAAHLAGNRAIFGYDLRNEPSLVDIAASIYPSGVHLPLLSHDLIKTYKERVSMKTARAAQKTTTWSTGAFAHMDTSTLYYYLNALHLLNSFLAANPGYPATTPTHYWQKFLSLLNASLSDYIGVQLTAIRRYDPYHLVTIGYHRAYLAALPANDRLDFRSIHMYPPASFDGFHEDLRFFEVLNSLASTPLVLEEYGVSNDRNGPQSSAVREMAMALYLRTLGGGGDVKWMFDDDAVGYSAYENNFGAVNVDGVPKPTYLASQAADAYWARTPYRSGFILQPDRVTGAGFVMMARDGMAFGGSLPYYDARVSYKPADAGVTWLDWSTPGVLRVTSTNDGRITLAMDALTGARAILSTSAPTPSPTPTSLVAATPSGTPTPWPTPTRTPTPWATPTPAAPIRTATPTPWATATRTPATWATATRTPAPWATPTATPSGPPPAGAPSPTATVATDMWGFPLTPVSSESEPAGAAMAARMPAALARSTATPTPSTTPSSSPAPTGTASAGSVTGLTVTLTLRAGVPQVVRYRASGPPPVVPIDLPAPDTGKGWYMVARGHNVDPPFLSGWLAQGGESMIGDPLTEAFSYQGLPTQYFDTLALRIGPHGLTTAPLGLVALGKANPRAKELPKRTTHYYDRATGHNIHGGFLKFWRAHGGLSFFGDPLTEELRVHGQTVQYFTGAEFVVDHSVPGGIALLPLGQRMWPSVRKVYGL